MPSLSARNIRNNCFNIVRDISQSDALFQLAELVLYNPGDVIIKEGDEADYVYFIHRGRASIQHEGITIAEADTGGYFGLMSLFDHAPRSADVIALKPTALYRIAYDVLRKPEFEETYLFLSELQIKNQQSYLRSMNEKVSRSYRDKLAISEKARFDSDFLIRLIAIMLIFQFILGAFVSYEELLTGMLGWIFTPICIFALGLLCFVYLKRNKLQISDYGWSFKGWYKQLPETLVYTSIICACAVTLKFILINFSSTYAGHSIFSLDPIFHNNMALGILIYIVYIILVPIQEFTIRGVFQTGLTNIFDEPARVWKAIFMSNIMFCAFHLHQSFLFAIIAFLPGLVWGYQYHRQKNLAGIIISHILVGIFCLLFLGLV